MNKIFKSNDNKVYKVCCLRLLLMLLKTYKVLYSEYFFLQTDNVVQDFGGNF